MSAIKVVLDRPSATYQAGETMTGHVVVTGSTSYNVVTVTVNGVLWAQTPPSHAGLLDAMGGVAEHCFFSLKVDAAKDGKCEGETSKIPFECPLQAERGTLPSEATEVAGQLGLLETYYGRFLHVRWGVDVLMKRGFFSKDLTATTTFNVTSPGQGWTPEVQQALAAKNTAVPFTLTADTLVRVKGSKTPVGKVPTELQTANFAIKGQLDSYAHPTGGVITGWYCVEHCDAVIPSVDLQIARIEYYPTSESTGAAEASEVEKLQIACGSDIPRGAETPISVMLPKWKCSPCTTRSNGQDLLGYEVNLIFTVLPADAKDDTQYQLIQSFPLHIYRQSKEADDAADAEA